MEEQSEGTAPPPPEPAPELTPAPEPILAAEPQKLPMPSGGDPFHAVAPPPPPPPPPAPAPPPPPPVIELEATGLSASDVRRPVVDAPPASSPPPIEPQVAQPQAAQPPPQPPPSSPPPPPSQPPPVAPKAPRPPSRFKRNAWAILCHLLLVLVIPTVFLGATLTFLIWQLRGKKDKHVEDQGREALNFQINVAALTAVLTISCLGAPLIVLVWFVAIVMSIIAARHALDGENYRYPWVFRIVSH